MTSDEEELRSEKLKKILEIPKRADKKTTYVPTIAFMIKDGICKHCQRGATCDIRPRDEKMQMPSCAYFTPISGPKRATNPD